MKDFLNELKKIPVPDWFGLYSSNDDLCPDADTYDSIVYDLAKECGIDINTAWGCSQYVIITENKDVYKIPFNGEYHEGDIYANIDNDFDDFETNYSEKAVEVYNNAVIDGVEKMFSKIEKIGFSCNGHPIYKQDYAREYLNAEKGRTSASKDSSAKAKKMLKEKKYVPFYFDWLSLAIDAYGEEEVENLLNFIKKENVDDLHRGNYGFDANNLPVIFDYSGFEG